MMKIPEQYRIFLLCLYRGYKRDAEGENEIHRKKSLGEDNHTYKEFDEENKEEDGGDDDDGDMITLTAGTYDMYI
jgi:hypothetical protein